MERLAKANTLLDAIRKYDDAHGAFFTGLEPSDMCPVLFGELCGDLCELAEYKSHLQATAALCVNDCKGLADALLAAASV